MKQNKSCIKCRVKGELLEKPDPKTLIITLFIFVFSFSSVKAQESIAAAGNNTIGSGGSVSYTVGQIAYTTNTGSGGSVVQGIQQPYEISVVTGLEETDIQLTLSVYPNPVTDMLLLKVENEKFTDLNFQLFDLSGNLKQDKKIVSNQTSIDMSNLSPGAYIVKVIVDNYEVKTFKIIKN